MLTPLRLLSLGLGAILVLANGNHHSNPPIQWNSQRVRLGGLLKRKAGLTKEQFLEHWSEHGQLFRTTNLSKSVLRYELMPINDTINAVLNASGTLTTNYDGIAMFEGTSFDVLLSVLSSPEAAEIIVPNEETFLDRSATITFPLNFGVVLDKISGP